MPSIKVFRLGESGVQLDKNPTRTDDNELILSQNATYDPTRKRLGGLSKRPGLDRWNSMPLGGVVLGGLEAPYKGTAGAPASGGGGGGGAGDAGGTGDPTLGGGVGPGDSAGGGNAGAGAGDAVLVDARVFNGGVQVFGGQRILAVGRAGNSEATAGWYMTSAGLLDAAWKLNTDVETVAGPPLGTHNSNAPDGAGPLNARPSPMTIANGNIYYADDIWAQTAAVAPVLPNIRRLAADGNTDAQILTIPDNPAILALATIPSHLVSVLYLLTEWGNGDACWVTTYDQITTGASAGKYGRVLRISGLDSGAYRVQQVLNLFTDPIGGLATASVPIPLANFLGRPWIGIWHGVNTTDPNVARIVPTGEDTWSVDKVTTFTTEASASDATCLATYHGKLYVGLTNRNAGVAHASIWSITPDDVATLEVTGSGGVLTSPTGWVSMAIFQDKLYASYAALNQVAKVYEYDGTTWTERVNGNGLIAYLLRADGDYLYAIGGLAATNTRSWLVTSDGTTWTDKSAKFAGNLGHGDLDLSAISSNIIVGFEQ